MFHVERKTLNNMWQEFRPPYYDAQGNLHTFMKYLYLGKWHYEHYICRPDGVTLIQYQ